jgi:phage terminase small subunit
LAKRKDATKPPAREAEPASGPPALTERQLRFVEEYVIDLNATQAAKRAGYRGKNLDKIGWELLQISRVRQQIEQRIADRIKRTQIDQDFTLKRLSWLADSNIKNVAEWKSGKVTLKDSSELTEAQAFSIESIKMIPTKKGPIIQFKMRRPDSAIELLAKHQGLLDGQGGEEDPALIEALARLDQAEAEDRDGAPRLDTKAPQPYGPATRGKDHLPELQAEALANGAKSGPVDDGSDDV